MKVIVQLL